MAYPTGNDDPSNNRNKSTIRNPSFPLEGDQIGKKGSEKRCRSTNSLVKRHSKVPKRNITTNYRGTENDTQSCNLEELRARFDHLKRYDLEEDDGEVAEDCTGCHVAHCEEDWESEAIV